MPIRRRSTVLHSTRSGPPRESQSLVDFGLWGGLVPGNLDELETLRDRGVVGLQGIHVRQRDRRFRRVDSQALRAGMRRAAELDLLVAVHAESAEMIRACSQQQLATGQTSVRDYLDSRPIEAELEAIKRAIELAGETVPIAHCARQLRPRSCAGGGSTSEWRRCYLRDLSALSFLHRRRHGPPGRSREVRATVAIRGRSSRAVASDRGRDHDRFRSFPFPLANEGTIEFLSMSGEGFPAASICCLC